MEKSGGPVTVTANGSVADKLPEVPVMTNCDTLAAVAAATFSVIVEPVVVLAGLNVAVTPEGSPLTVNATVPLNPDCGATAIVAVPVLPEPMVKLDTGDVSLKPGAAATVSAMLVCAVTAPTVPVMVTVAVPAAALEAAESFNVLPVNAAVTPAGSVPTENVGVPANPFSAVTPMALLADAPGAMLMVDGLAASVKLGPALIVRLTLTELTLVPDVPVMVIELVPGVAA